MTAFLNTAVAAAREAGQLLRDNFESELNVNEFCAHDIKLELDVLSQELIAARILRDHPTHAIYGEEGIAGDQQSEHQWIVDPIDGTVNYFYGIPHFCISIAVRRAGEIILGVIYDPMRDELWQVQAGGEVTMNGAPCAVSQRSELKDAVLSVGFSKTRSTIDAGLPLFENMITRARKCRLMGSAALDMAYVASGRLDAYIEQVVSLWDVAAGKILVEAAGGRVEMKPHPDLPDKISIVASSGRIPLT